MKPTVILQTDSVRVWIMPLAAGEATAWHHHGEVTDTMVGMRGEIRVELRNKEESFLLKPDQSFSRKFNLPLAYNAQADQESRQAMQTFFKEIFASP